MEYFLVMIGVMVGGSFLIVLGQRAVKNIKDSTIDQVFYLFLTSLKAAVGGTAWVLLCTQMGLPATPTNWWILIGVVFVALLWPWWKKVSKETDKESNR